MRLFYSVALSGESVVMGDVDSVALNLVVGIVIGLAIHISASLGKFYRADAGENLSYDQ